MDSKNDWRNELGIPKDYHGSRSILDSKAYSGDYVQPSDAHTQHIYSLIQQYIADHSVPEQLMYFVEGDWLITYAYHRETTQLLSREINYLERRIEKLERPWWKRW